MLHILVLLYTHNVNKQSIKQSKPDFDILNHFRVRALEVMHSLAMTPTETTTHRRSRHLSVVTKSSL
ncbi:hypothetical protein TNIN_123111 [Trichonephila inaurata madagascariensis]|uniref:Uncharacterized protein n=1 Tax=Trichonephila inaurata madagascariensis TaxID=2747483 RepID=A0A8X6XCM2_9ARAC|nr:hypothetical protein TNIN_123111 [Trichonephila inaurata madagascariensis]